jgi:hypothetical protein
MIVRGVSDIKGIRRVNTRPGQITESSGLLQLYLLATEKDNVQKRLAWVGRQKDQAEKRLSEIAHTMQAVKQVVEKKASLGPASPVRSKARNVSIEY